MRCTLWMVATILLFGCSLDTTNDPAAAKAPRNDQQTHSGDDKPDDLEPNEAWSSRDTPTLFSNELEFDVDALPLNGEATHIPWASSYWPVYQDSINHRWDGSDSQSPAAKYGAAFGIDDVEDQVSKAHGTDKYKNRTACSETSDCDSDLGEQCSKRTGQDEGYCIPSWWGICHAWAPVAIIEREPQQPVTRNGVEFKVNDIKALATLAYNRTSSKFVSLRCNENDSADEIEYDEYDRPTGSDEECRDTNPGTYHVLLTNFLGIKGESFVEDRTFDYQVWNQPLRAYRITQMENVTIAQAHALIGVPESTDPDSGLPELHHEFDGLAASQAWEHYDPITVIPGGTVTIEMTGDGGDADLYVRFGSEPTLQDYDCRPWVAGSDEECSLDVSDGEDTLYVSVYGYPTSGDSEFTITIDLTTGEDGQGTDAVEYEFNENAADLYHVRLEVDYITEAHSSTDGNLSERIDNYTRTDRYQYVLEVDDDGKIIGGEWIGSSKRNHPDFLWLPTGRSAWPQPAGGSIQWDLVKDLIDSSQIEEEPEVTGGATTVEETLDLDKDEWAHFGPYEVTGTIEATLTGSGDADLYVRKDAQPTKTAYDCRPYRPSSEESCSIDGPATFYVSVHGYQSSQAELKIQFSSEEEEVAAATADPTTHLNEDSAVDFQEMALFVIEVTDGQNITLETESANDVDLYVRMDDPPTTGVYDERAYTYSGDETIEFTAPSAGMLHIGVHGWEAADFTLTTSDS